jgi:hypothetical protein
MQQMRGCLEVEAWTAQYIGQRVLGSWQHAKITKKQKVFDVQQVRSSAAFHPQTWASDCSCR